MSRITDADLEKSREYVAYFSARKETALKRISTTHSSDHGWYFAIVGADIEANGFIDDMDLYEIRRVFDPPSYIELACALKNKVNIDRINFYSGKTTHELFLKFSEQKDIEYDDFVIGIAERVVSLLKIKTGVDFIVPAALDRSWSVIAGCEQDSVRSIILEDFPNAFKLSDQSYLCEMDLRWVATFFHDFHSLFSQTRFYTAVHTISLSNQHRDKRMTVANLWVGIEAILDVQSELRFRLASELAAFLEPRGNSRVELHKAIKKLYDFRSKAVHGAAINEADFEQNIVSVRDILRRVLIRCIEQKHLPTALEFEENIHSDSLWGAN